MTRRSKYLIAALLLGTVFCSPAMGQENSGLTVSVGGAYYDGGDRSAADAGIGGHVALGYDINHHWGVEVSYARFDVEADFDPDIQENVDLWQLNITRNFGHAGPIKPYIIGGIGVADEIKPFTFDTFKDTQYNLGVGTEFYINKYVALRVEGRGNYSVGYNKINPFATAGLKVKFH